MENRLEIFYSIRCTSVSNRFCFDVAGTQRAGLVVTSRYQASKLEISCEACDVTLQELTRGERGEEWKGGGALPQPLYSRNSK